MFFQRSNLNFKKNNFHLYSFKLKMKVYCINEKNIIKRKKTSFFVCIFICIVHCNYKMYFSLLSTSLNLFVWYNTIRQLMTYTDIYLNQVLHKRQQAIKFIKSVICYVLQRNCCGRYQLLLLYFQCTVNELLLPIFLVFIQFCRLIFYLGKSKKFQSLQIY